MTVRPLDQTEIPQPLAESIQECTFGLVIRITEEADPCVGYGRELRLDSERRSEEAAGRGTEECSTLHYSIT